MLVLIWKAQHQDSITLFPQGDVKEDSMDGLDIRNQNACSADNSCCGVKRFPKSSGLEVIDKQFEELLVEQLRFDDSFETEMSVMVEWMNDLDEFVMDNEMSIVDWVEFDHIFDGDNVVC
ncbi:hypothetical protein Tco_0140991 [Tanacetum coccineum]